MTNEGLEIFTCDPHYTTSSLDHRLLINRTPLQFPARTWFALQWCAVHWVNKEPNYGDSEKAISSYLFVSHIVGRVTFMASEVGGADTFYQHPFEQVLYV